MNGNPYCDKESKRNFHADIDRAMMRQTVWFEGHLTCRVCGVELTPYIDDDDWEAGRYKPEHPDDGCVWRRIDDALKGQLALQYVPFHPTEPSTTQCVTTMPTKKHGEKMGLSENLIVCP